MRLNTRESACQTTDPVFPGYVTKDGVTYCEVTGVTGTLVFSMPMKKQRFFEAN